MHDLRHTYATRLFALGQHPRAVQDLLGHSRFEITMNLYTATVPEVLREAADRMDSVFVAAGHQLGTPVVAALPPEAPTARQPLAGLLHNGPPEARKGLRKAATELETGQFWSRGPGRAERVGFEPTKAF